MKRSRKAAPQKAKLMKDLEKSTKKQSIKILEILLVSLTT